MLLFDLVSLVKILFNISIWRFNLELEEEEEQEEEEEGGSKEVEEDEEEVIFEDWLSTSSNDNAWFIVLLEAIFQCWTAIIYYIQLLLSIQMFEISTFCLMHFNRSSNVH